MAYSYLAKVKVALPHCHTHQELWTALRVLVQLSVQVSQVLVYAVQLSLQALVLLVFLVKFPFVDQTLLLIHNGRKQTADENRMKFGEIIM